MEEKEIEVKNESLNERTRWSRFETFSIVYLVLGIPAFFIAINGFVPLYGIAFAIVAIIFSIVGLVFGTISYKNDGPRLRPLKKAAYIVNIIALIFSIIMIIVSLILFVLFYLSQAA